jgi:hypothetical protein
MNYGSNGKLGFIGQDSADTGSWVTSPDGTVMQNLDTGNVVVLPDASSPSSYPEPTQPAASGGDWWSGLSSILTPLASIGSSIAKAVTGSSTPSLPPGYTRNPITGQIVPTGYVAPTSTMSSWLLPLGVLGIGAVLLMRKK